MSRPLIHTPEGVRDIYGAEYRRKLTVEDRLHHVLSSFGYDPLQCECGATMLFLELYFNHKRVSLEEMYEEIMSRSRGRRSSA